MARKRLNKNLIVALTLCMLVILLVLSVLMLQRLGHRDPKYFIELAQQYEGQEEWHTAGVFYKKAWERSNDAVHLVSLGSVLLNAGEVGPAVHSWRLALIDQPDLIEAHTRQLELLLELARLYGRGSNWKAVLEAAETFLQAVVEKTAGQEAFGHNARGLALLRLAGQDEGNAEQGEAELRTATGMAPDVVDYTVDLANHYLRPDRLNEDADKGERLFTELIELYASPGADAAKIRLTYAQHLAWRGRLDEAEAYFEESLALAENEPAVLRSAKLGYAVFLSQQWARAVRREEMQPSATALFEKAEAILKQCIEADPDGYDPYLQLAILYGSALRHTDMIDICEARLQRGLSRKGVKADSNRLNMFNLMIYASEACIAEAVAAQESNDEDGRQQWIAKAQQYVTDAKGELPSHPRVIAQAGRVKLAQGLDRQALEDLRAADEAYQAYDAVKWLMQAYWDNKMTIARVHLKLNEAGAAKASLEEVLDQARRQRSGDVRLWTLYAQVLFQNNDLDRALVICDEILDTDPNNAEVLRLKAAVDSFRAVLASRQFALEENNEASVAVLRDALKKNPAEPGLVRETVRELLSLGLEEDARAVVQKALAVKPDNVQLQALAVLTREGLSPEMREQTLLEMINAQEDDHQRTLELIGFYVRKKDFEKTLPLLDKALEHLTAKDTPLARKAAIGQHRALLATKLSVAAALDDAEAQAAARDAAAAFNVDGAGGKSILGQYHMQHKEYDLAIKAFRETIEVHPTDARSLTQLGQCLQLVERPDEAEMFYERAIHANPHEGQAYKGLAMLAKARGDTEAYEQALQTCERLTRTDPWVQAEVIARDEQSDPQAAVARREKLLANNPDDFNNVERLATLCDTIGDTRKADGYYARLLELRPDDAGLVVTVSNYYRRTGRPDRSFELVTGYAESRPNVTEKANARLLIALHYLSTGDLDRTEATLLAAADMAETFEVAQSLAEFYHRNAGRPDQALPWWDKAVDHARAAHASRLPRVLAARISCLLHRSLNDTETARRYVEELLADFPDYPQSLRLKSEIYSRRGEIEEAIDSLTDYLRRKPGDPNALFERALHHRTRGRFVAAVEDLEAIKRRHPLVLEPRLLLARLWQQTGRSDLWIRELESLNEDAKNASDSAQARVLQELIQAYIHEERLADAERMVTARINQTSVNPEARWFFLRGRIAFELGDHGKALADVQRGAQISDFAAEGITNVLNMYLRVGRPTEGIKYYERYAPTEPTSAALVSRYAQLLVSANRKQESVEKFRRAMNLAILGGPFAGGTVTADLRAAFSGNDAVAEAIVLFDREDVRGSMARVNGRILVRLYQMAGRHDDAAARLNQLIETSQDDRERAELLHELGDIYQAADLLQGARRAYEQALQYNGDNWITLNNLAYLLSDRLSENKLARPYAERSVALADTPDTRDTLGWIYVRLGEYRLAIAELSRAVRLDPTDALPYYHLGEAYRRRGQADEAAKIFRAGRDLARSTDNSELIALFDASLDRVARSDSSP